MQPSVVFHKLGYHAEQNDLMNDPVMITYTLVRIVTGQKIDISVFTHFKITPL
jgi:hypothetical protein